MKVLKSLKIIKPYVIKGMRRIPESENLFRIPKKRISCAETEQYFKTNRSTQEYFKEFASEKLFVNPPRVLNKEFGEKYNCLSQYVCESFLIQVENARYYLNSHSIFTKENYHLAIASSHPEVSMDEHVVFKMLYIPRPKMVSGTGLLLVTQCDNNYYHCLFQIPARIWFLESIGFDRTIIDHYFLGLNNSGFQKEILAALKLPKENFIDVNVHPHLKVEKLLLTPMFYNPEPWMIPRLKDLFLGSLPPEIEIHKRIYVSRNKAKVRRILKEEILWRVLEKHGFTFVTLENMTIKEQAQLFSNARMIVSAHGAALANTVFCNPGTKILEFRAVDHTILHYRLYEHLSSIAGLEHFTFMVKSLPGKYSKNASENDLIVEEENLEQIIEDFIYNT